MPTLLRSYPFCLMIIGLPALLGGRGGAAVGAPPEPAGREVDAPQQALEELFQLRSAGTLVDSGAAELKLAFRSDIGLPKGEAAHTSSTQEIALVFAGDRSLARFVEKQPTAGVRKAILADGERRIVYDVPRATPLMGERGPLRLFEVYVYKRAPNVDALAVPEEWSMRVLVGLPGYINEQRLANYVRIAPGSSVRRLGTNLLVEFDNGLSVFKYKFDLALDGALTSFSQVSTKYGHASTIEVAWQRQGKMVVPVKRTATDRRMGAEGAWHQNQSVITFTEVTPRPVKDAELKVARMGIRPGTPVHDEVHGKRFVFGLANWQENMDEDPGVPEGDASSADEKE